MTSNNIDMKDIFSKLSEKNKDVIILIAKSLKNIQEENVQSYNATTQIIKLKKWTQ